jgi:zinc protease
MNTEAFRCASMALFSVLVLAGCAGPAAVESPPAQSDAPPAAAPAPEPEPEPEPASGGIEIPIEYYKLGNGLKIVLSRDTTAPTVTVGVYYHIGFRIEPRGRTGFAHLFEHLMFQGSGNLGKMEFIRLVEGNGGVLNGSTRFDYTNYYEVVPAHTLETVLWAEADRMKALEITQANLANQQGVVKNEVRDNVMNQPYGGFPWLTLPQVANANWFNAHNFYGDLADLDAATLEDARSFFQTYYAPNNAALIVAGDFDPAEAKGWIEKYFGPIPARPQPARPDLSEPPQTEPKRDTYTDELAPRPALALAWRVPEQGTPEHAAFGLLDQILLQGSDSALWQRLVQQRGYSNSVGGGINLLGNLFTYDGPMLWMVYLIHDGGVAPEAILADIEGEIERIRTQGPTKEELERAHTKIRAALYDIAGSSTRFGLTELLASFALFDDDPERINRIEDEFRAVPPELISEVARRYLSPAQLTVQVVEPGPAPARPAGAVP